MDLGPPAAYIALQEGAVVLASDGTPVGTVARVVADEQLDIFRGIVVDTPDGERFADQAAIEETRERGVILKAEDPGRAA